MLTTAIGGAFGVVTAMLTGDKGTQAAAGKPDASGAAASGRSPECELRSPHDLYCTGTDGIKTYTDRDRASGTARPLGPTTHFGCWGKGAGDEIWVWAPFKSKDEPWGNVPGRVISTEPIPATGLAQCQ
ncbi:hypothetical protein [Streptomyces sp. enrichment culture]|uniref:hypothetical protein n=1 Tax=Streptomyces sp. enrichment culture TaxID=1795815 RepID=UPI003F554303